MGIIEAHERFADVRVIPSAQKISTEERSLGVLRAWTALEALEPFTYRRPEDLWPASSQNDVVDLNGALPSGVPWGRRDIRKGKELFYLVPLGAIDGAAADERLRLAFGVDEERQRASQGKTLMAAAVVNARGVPLENNALAVASYAWSLPRALRGDLATLGNWAYAESGLLSALNDVLRGGAGKQAGSLTVETIRKTYRWLVGALGLAPDLVEPPAFALKIWHRADAKAPPEPPVLSSFFLRDLAEASAAIGTGRAPTGLRRYLAMEAPARTFDLLQDRRALDSAVAPGVAPCVRWPQPGGFPLALLQQAAVNVCRAELAGAQGVVAVNGPPGTGKTTLLRDLVAACVFDRAKAMAAFDDPNDAFGNTGVRVKAGQGAFKLHRLHPSLKGHEVLVTSSNNRAVENVSRELPAMSAVDRGRTGLGYFKTVSDRLGDGEDGNANGSTWGLIAAVLGNSSNRHAFAQGFWWDKDRGFRTYLKAAKGDDVVIEERSRASGEVTRRTPAVVAIERPPTPRRAKTAWREAREKFEELRREVEDELRGLEAARKARAELPRLREAVATHEAKVEAALGMFERLATAVEAGRVSVRAAIGLHEHGLNELQALDRQRPGWLFRLFNTERARRWRSEASASRERVEASTRRAQAAANDLNERERVLGQATIRLRDARAGLEESRSKLDPLERIFATWREACGDRFLDERFHDLPHERRQLTAPWLPDALHRKREDLFVAAVQVHRAFIDAAASRIYHNLSIFMNSLQGKGNHVQNEADLWSTLFCVVPVVSTTFASVDRMLGRLGAGSFGWLLIDEAGQAVPQAAVGAIARAKRTVVVGDPLQVPPVVSLPGGLVREVCKRFAVDPDRWAGPEASVQALADHASRFQAAFLGQDGPRRVGAPLLVHRRCQEPMFAIANAVAYDGLMVQAATPKPAGPVGLALGPSRWIDVDGQATSKWCADEGERVAGLFRSLAEAGVLNPDLFVITPFRLVAQEARRRLERERTVLEALAVSDARAWLADRVGTIHAFQGREAEAVVVVLGAPSRASARARNWAASTPNILNVAVTRAKERLYVVGSRGAWSGVGCARELAAALPVG